MLSEIGHIRPRPCWFIIAPAVAILFIDVTLVLSRLSFRGLAAVDWADWVEIPILIFMAGYVLVVALLYFPLGLWGVFLWDMEAYHEYWGIFCYVGWSVYLVLIARGLQFPGRRVFFALVLLLALDVVGFPVRDVMQRVNNDLMW